MNKFKGKKLNALVFSLLIINSLLLAPKMVFSESMDSNQQIVEIQSRTKYVETMVHYKSLEDIKRYYIYDDGYYRGRLEITEYWQNSDYSWDVAYGGYVTCLLYTSAYGIINDNRIKKIEVTLENGDILIQDEFYEDMFLVTWKSPNDSIIDFAGIRAYDEDSNIIFEGIYGY